MGVALDFWKKIWVTILKRLRITDLQYYQNIVDSSKNLLILRLFRLIISIVVTILVRRKTALFEYTVLFPLI